MDAAFCCGGGGDGSHGDGGGSLQSMFQIISHSNSRF